MTKPYFIELAKYNIWANDIVLNWLQQIDETQWQQHITSSFNNIADTCIHIAGAEKIWLERWQLKENLTFLSNEFAGTKDELISIWQQVSKNILQFVEQMNEEDLNKTFTFKRLKGDINTMQFYHAFAHVFNHSSYHRGQLVTMLRQASFTNVSSTDMLTYFPH